MYIVVATNTEILSRQTISIFCLLSFIAVWTSGSWCASQISCCQWCLCSAKRCRSPRWQSDPAEVQLGAAAVDEHVLLAAAGGAPWVGP